MTHTHRSIKLFSLALYAACAATSAHARIDHIVQDFSPAPDGDGSIRVIDTIEEPALNNAGQFSFRGQFSDIENGSQGATFRIMRADTDGTLTQIADRADFSPDGVFKYASFSTATRINDNGDVLFSTDLGFVAFVSSEDAIFVGDGTTNTQIARENDPAPDGNGIHFAPFASHINEAGHVAFAETFDDTAGNHLDDSGLLINTTGTNQLLIREPHPAPDATGAPSGNIGNFTVPPVFNDNNQGAFFASLFGALPPGPRRQGIFRVDPTDLIQIVRAGMDAPDLPTDDDWKFEGLDANLEINSAGQVVFSASLNETGGAGTSLGKGIFVGDGTTITQIAREGHPVPENPGKVFSSFLPLYPDINDNGDVLFQASFGPDENTSTDHGLFLYSDGTVTRIAQDGQAPPDGNGTYTTFRNNGIYTNPDRPGLNNAGQVAYYNILADTALPGLDSFGLFLTDGIETIQAVRGNQPLAGSTTNFFRARLTDRSFTDLSFNDLGQVAFKARLATNDWGYFLFTPDLHWRGTAADNQWDSRTNWTISTDPAHVHDVFVDPPTDLTITGPGPAGDTVRNLTIASPASPATLLLDNNTHLTTEDFNLLPNATIDIQTATLSVNGTANLQGTLNIDGQLNLNGHAKGPAHLTGTGQTTVNGSYNPGASPHVANPTTALTIAPTGSLHIDILQAATPTPGSHHDQLNITAPLTLQGSLDVIPLDDLGPVTDTPLGTEFNVMTYTDRTGLFSKINALINNNFAFAPLFRDTDTTPDGTDDTLFLRAAVPGDLNFDHKVSTADLSEFALNFGSTPGLYDESTQTNSWQRGDFNTDGLISVADLSLLALNFGFELLPDGTTTPPTPLTFAAAARLIGIDPDTLTGAAVPEPATLLALLLTPTLIRRNAAPPTTLTPQTPPTTP